MTEPNRREAGQQTPAEFGVHPATGTGPLPAYVRRPHDDQLRAVLDPQNEYSRLVVVRGDALTGTSRAVYEAVTEVLADWVLEDLPTAAALAARLEAPVLGRVDHVLEAEGPVVAIATIWPGYWDSYTAAAAAGRGGADPAAAVGRLLAPLDVLAEYDLASLDPARGGVVDVPDRFTAAELIAAADAGDPVLAAAAAAAGPDGQLIQCLAGARELLDRYAGPGADPHGQAVITPRWTPPGSATPARCPLTCCGTPRPATCPAGLTRPAGIRPAGIRPAGIRPAGGTRPWPGPPAPAGLCGRSHPATAPDRPATGWPGRSGGITPPTWRGCCGRCTRREPPGRCTRWPPGWLRTQTPRPCRTSPGCCRRCTRPGRPRRSGSWPPAPSRPLTSKNPMTSPAC